MPEVKAPEQPMPGETTASTEIATRAVEAHPVIAAPRMAMLSDDEIRRTWRVASALAASQMFTDAKQAEQAFAKILIGRDLGISATQALMAIDLVEGSISLRGILLARFLREHPTYDYRLENHTLEACTCVIERKRDGEWRDVGDWTFTLEDARTAGLIKADKPKSAWNAHRKNMLMWRAIANATRAHAPDVFGGVPVYVEGELERPAELTAGVGDGGAQGLDLGPDVEEILQRAAELGHAGYADRATAEMTLGSQSPGFVAGWVAQAKKELDALEAAQAGDAPKPEPEVEGEPAPEVEAEPEEVSGEVVESVVRMLADADELEEAAASAEAAGDADVATDLRSQADSIRAEAQAKSDTAQESLELGGDA